MTKKMGRNKKGGKRSAEKNRSALFAAAGILGLLTAFSCPALAETQSLDGLLPSVPVFERSEYEGIALLPQFQIPRELPVRYDARDIG